MTILNLKKLQNSFSGWSTGKPFSYAIVDNFFPAKIARQLSNEFPDFDSAVWHEYDSPLEIKKMSNSWNLFPPTTYAVFSYLNSHGFVSQLQQLLAIDSLIPDNGLNGGGWHIHAQGGRLNPHLDYSMHPKLPCQRKINLLVYLNRNWKKAWGGQLGFYSDVEGTPGKLVKKIMPTFNRAVFFDTTMNSWHGLCEQITCPQHEYRKSIALYYLTHPPTRVDPRGKALFYPTPDQLGDKSIEALIKTRANANTAATVYKK